MGIVQCDSILYICSCGMNTKLLRIQVEFGGSFLVLLSRARCNLFMLQPDGIEYIYSITSPYKTNVQLPPKRSLLDTCLGVLFAYLPCKCICSWLFFLIIKLKDGLKLLPRRFVLVKLRESKRLLEPAAADAKRTL